MEDELSVSDECSPAPSFSEVPRRRLRDLVARQGPALMNSPNAEATLRAVCHGYEREAPLLVAALRAEIPARILAAPAMPTSILSDDIAEQRQLDPKAAAWAVESWAYALHDAPMTLTMLRQDALPLTMASGQAAFSLGRIVVEETMPTHPSISDSSISEPTPLVMSVWPPTPNESPALENTSGTDGPLPTAVAAKHWHWGACSVFWLWLMFHKKPLLGVITLLIGFVPIVGGLVGLGLALYFGSNGYKIAWQSRRFESVDQFFLVQHRWSLWGTIGTAVATVMIVGAAVWWALAQQAAMPTLGI